MKAKDFLSDDFLQHFRTGKQPNGFLGEIDEIFPTGHKKSNERYFQSR